MPEVDDAQPATMADLHALERDIITSFAEANEGLVLAMAGLCLTLVNTGKVEAETLIAHLRLATETMMRARKSELTQAAVDQLIFAIQQLDAGGSRTDAAH